MQYIPCNSALLAQKTLFLTQKGTVFQIYKSFGIWEDLPPPCWEKFPNNIVFFCESVPNIEFDENAKEFFCVMWSLEIARGWILNGNARILHSPWADEPFVWIGGNLISSRCRSEAA